MDVHTWGSTLAEMKVATVLTEQGYEVFNQISGKSPFDFVAHKDGSLLKVEVKSTMTKASKYGSWEIAIKRTRSNRTSSTTHHFNGDLYDILAIYIHEIDRVCFFNSKLVTNQSSITINKRNIDNMQYLAI